MKLEIRDPENILQDDFIKWFLKELRNKIINSVNIRKLELWDIYFNNQTLYKSIYKKKISSLDIIKSGAANLQCVKNKESLLIQINPNINIIGLDRVTLNSACKLINYGNTEMDGYPIFTNIFEDIASNIHVYIDKFIFGV